MLQNYLSQPEYLSLKAQKLERQAQRRGLATPTPQVGDPLTWATDRLTIVHPVRGRIPFVPYAYQADFLSGWQARRRICLKARQVGYSLAFAVEALYVALHFPDAMILLVSRSQDMATNLLRYCYQALSSLKGAPSLTKQNESEMGFPNGARIKSIPANRSTGRGFAATRVYLDEFAYAEYSEDIYQSVSPAIAQGGTLTVASTPNGMGNLFHRLWLSEGFDKTRIDWRMCPAYWTLEERAAAIPPEASEWYLEQRPHYTDAAWAAEYDCDFSVSGGQVFRKVHEATEGERVSDHSSHRIVVGVDFGQTQDYTVLSAVCADCRQQIALDRFNRAEWSVTRDRLRAFCGNLSASLIVAERNSAGGPNVEALQAEGLPVVGFDTTPTSKRPLIQGLALAFERGELRILPDVVQLNELEAYQMTFSPLAHQPTYHAPSGAHDDTVIALALAWLGMMMPREQTRVVYAPVKIGQY